MELAVASLALSVAPLIVPAYQDIESLYQRLCESRGFPKQLRIFKAQFRTQKTKFRNDTLLLFSSTRLNQDTIQAMLIDIEHEKWNDQDFQRDFAEYLGGSFQNTIEPFKVIGETLRLLEAELEKVIRKSKFAYRGFRYSPKTKTLDALLNNLRCSISDLHDLRMQRTELIENQAKQQLLSRQAGNAAASSDSFSAVLDVQSAAERVYETVASVADCRCHKYYFQLRSDLQTGKPPPFALSWLTEPLLSLFVYENGAHSTSSTTLVNQTLPSELASDEKTWEREQSSTTECACTCIAVRIESQIAQPQIISLCDSVKAAATTSSQGLSICIGLLPHQTHQHLLYKEPLKPKVTQILYRAQRTESNQ
ncbi:hypothetical protein BDD12DRAFT_914308 [Trichophaea hybrida]|nr:hypothetical protein BDD12DRAFT_914308 [Trichophaea hybrida]